MKFLNLRSEIQVINKSDGLQLNDSATGFAIELEEKYKNITNEKSAETLDLFNMLQKIGFTNDLRDISEIRRIQRIAFRESTPSTVERIRELLSSITTDIPFFRDRVSDYDPKKINNIDDFKKIPFMRKRDIRCNFPNGLIPDGIDVAEGLENGELTIVSTSGSTDDRLQIIARTEIDRLPFGSDDLLGITIGGKQPNTELSSNVVYG